MDDKLFQDIFEKFALLDDAATLHKQIADALAQIRAVCMSALEEDLDKAEMLAAMEEIQDICEGVFDDGDD